MSEASSPKKVDHDETTYEECRALARKSVFKDFEIDKVTALSELVECCKRYLKLAHKTWKRNAKVVLDKDKMFRLTNLGYAPGHSTVFDTMSGMSCDVIV